MRSNNEASGQTSRKNDPDDREPVILCEFFGSGMLLTNLISHLICCCLRCFRKADNNPRTWWSRSLAWPPHPSVAMERQS
ncbi:hypothetical protein DTO166G4_7770 [Paecilomyces variotii]|nr:hypothetical protein DTO166G4_7770 [Paecilomyces variotii]KAJ9228737.1 hypothetical protein DTO166G5_8366 [Paecilomyces variotii]KAJ9309641.1 hypothetical protein DTO217A2_931 [Paecilomyces variotii]